MRTSNKRVYHPGDFVQLNGKTGWVVKELEHTPKGYTYLVSGPIYVFSALASELFLIKAQPRTQIQTSEDLA